MAGRETPNYVPINYIMKQRTNILPIYSRVENSAMTSSTYTQLFSQHTVLVGKWGIKCIFLCIIQCVYPHAQLHVHTYRGHTLLTWLSILTNNFLIYRPTPFKFDRKIVISLPNHKWQRNFVEKHLSGLCLFNKLTYQSVSQVVQSHGDPVFVPLIMKAFLSDGLELLTIRWQIQWPDSQWLCLIWYRVWVFQTLSPIISVLSSFCFECGRTVFAKDP